MLIDRPAIAALIPHDGEMCLLDRVLAWDATHITCASEGHRAPGNPLRRAGKLGILCGIEYAAQAMALHGALCGKGGPAARGGYLASLRALRWQKERLDLLEGSLTIAADRLHGEVDRVIYAFALIHDHVTILDGRAAVVLAAVPV